MRLIPFSALESRAWGRCRLPFFLQSFLLLYVGQISSDEGVMIKWIVFRVVGYMLASALIFGPERGWGKKETGIGCPLCPFQPLPQLVFPWKETNEESKLPLAWVDVLPRFNP